MILGMIIGLVFGIVFTVLWFNQGWFREKRPELPTGTFPELPGANGGSYRAQGEVAEDAPDTPFDPQKSYEVISDRLMADSKPEPPRSRDEGDSLTDYELEVIRKGTCPDCGSIRFLSGPRGGMAQNFKCGSDECGSRFNDMGPFGIDRISDASPDRRLAS